MDISILHKKEGIILHAIDVINEFGIQAVSTKEVAKRQGIAESTLFKYFPKKNDLLRGVLEQFCLYDQDIFHTAIQKEPKEALNFYFNAYLTYYENYPAVTAILQAYDLLRSIPELQEKANNIYLNRLEFTKQLLAKAQEAEIICKELDVEQLADLFNAAIRGVCLKWRIYNFSFSLREQAVQQINILLTAFGGEVNPSKKFVLA